MVYIFLDESGDLGFQKLSSKWFLFTIAIVSDKRALERVVKKVWRHLRKKHKHLAELHAYHENDATRKQLLKLVCQYTGFKNFINYIKQAKSSH